MLAACQPAGAPERAPQPASSNGSVQISGSASFGIKVGE